MRSNYFINMINQFKTDNWIVALKPEDIQRSGKRIFKEMVRGYIDYEKHGKYYLDPKFLDNLIIAATNELEINSLYYRAVSFYWQYYPQDPLVSSQIAHLEALCFIYSTILAKLQQVKVSMDIGYLADISVQLYSYRNHLI